MPVSRLFNDSADAHAAVAELRQSGFRPGDIQVVSMASGYVSAQSLVRKGLLRDRAEEYAGKVRAGATLLLISPPVGTAFMATEILQRRYPADTDAAAVTHEGALYDEAAPLSSALGIPTLLNDDAHFSKVLGVKLLSRSSFYVSKLFGLPLLTRGGRPLFNIKLSHNPAPLSSLLHLPVLIRER